MRHFARPNSLCRSLRWVMRLSWSSAWRSYPAPSGNWALVFERLKLWNTMQTWLRFLPAWQSDEFSDEWTRVDFEPGHWERVRQITYTKCARKLSEQQSQTKNVRNSLCCFIKKCLSLYFSLFFFPPDSCLSSAIIYEIRCRPRHEIQCWRRIIAPYVHLRYCVLGCQMPSVWWMDKSNDAEFNSWPRSAVLLRFDWGW